MTAMTKSPPAAKPDLWRFVLSPVGDSASALPERLAAAVAYAEANGLRVAAVRLDLDAAGAAHGEGVTMREWLKRTLRHYGLRASWPETADEAGPKANSLLNRLSDPAVSLRIKETDTGVPNRITETEAARATA